MTMATLALCPTTLAAYEKPYVRERITQHSTFDHASNSRRTNARCSRPC